MLRVLILASLAVASAAQTCAVATIPPINGLCPAGYTLINNARECCNKLAEECADKLNPNTGVSDCPRMANYCTHSAYKELMATECRKTCGLCNGGGACKDEVNPATGVSDCPRMANMCNHSAYKELMAKQCRKTCCLC